MPTWGHGMSGAPERALAKARSRSFPFQFKPNGNQYLSLTGGPGVYIAFFGTGFAAVLSPILCTVRIYVQRPVQAKVGLLNNTESHFRGTVCRSGSRIRNEYFKKIAQGILFTRQGYERVVVAATTAAAL